MLLLFHATRIIVHVIILAKITLHAILQFLICVIQFSEGLAKTLKQSQHSYNVFVMPHADKTIAIP